MGRRAGDAARHASTRASARSRAPAHPSMSNATRPTPSVRAVAAAAAVASGTATDASSPATNPTVVVTWAAAASSVSGSGPRAATTTTSSTQRSSATWARPTRLRTSAAARVRLGSMTARRGSRRAMPRPYSHRDRAAPATVQPPRPCSPRDRHGPVRTAQPMSAGTVIGVASLDGFTIGITADRRWKEQADLFTRRGAAVLHGPTLATRFLSDDPDLRAATHALVERPPDLLIATTGVGIRAWLEAAQTWGIADELLAALGAARTVARGPKAANALAQAGLPVHMRAKSERMEEVAELLRSEPAASGRVALQRYGEDSLDAQAVLDARGADVVALSVYQWQLPADTGPARGLVQAACSGEVDVVTFTSAPAVVNLLGI